MNGRKHAKGYIEGLEMPFNAPVRQRPGATCYSDRARRLSKVLANLSLPGGRTA